MPASVGATRAATSCVVAGSTTPSVARLLWMTRRRGRVRERIATGEQAPRRATALCRWFRARRRPPVEQYSPEEPRLVEIRHRVVPERWVFLGLSYTLNNVDCSPDRVDLFFGDRDRLAVRVAVHVPVGIEFGTVANRGCHAASSRFALRRSRWKLSPRCSRLDGELVSDVVRSGMKPSPGCPRAGQLNQSWWFGDVQL